MSRRKRALVEIANLQSRLQVDRRLIRRLVSSLLRREGMSAELSVAIVGDDEIRELNRRFLDRDAGTDVLSFCYERADDFVSGEVVVNADEALRQGTRRRHLAEDELLLYVAHGLLHLIGYDDQSPGSRSRMREREREALLAVGRVLLQVAPPED